MGGEYDLLWWKKRFFFGFGLLSLLRFGIMFEEWHWFHVIVFDSFIAFRLFTFFFYLIGVTTVSLEPQVENKGTQTSSDQCTPLVSILCMVLGIAELSISRGI